MKDCTNWKAHHAADHRVDYWKNRRKAAKAAKNGVAVAAGGGGGGSVAGAAAQGAQTNQNTVYFPQVPSVGLSPPVMPGPCAAADVKGMPLFQFKLLAKASVLPKRG